KPPQWISYLDYLFWQEFGVKAVTLVGGNIQIDYAPADQQQKKSQLIRQHFKELISLPYFQQAVQQLIHDDRGNRIYSVTDTDTIPYGDVPRLPDGSYLIERFAKHINPAMIKATKLEGVDYAASSNKERQKLFAAFLDELQDSGYKVVFFVPPIGPHADIY